MVVRNYLSDDLLPPSEAVRVEEFVNYFNGGYGRASEAFAIGLDAAAQPFASSSEDGSDGRKVWLRVGVQAPSFPDITVPDSVVLVVDRSGSMGEMSGYGDESQERYKLVHQAVELLLSGLPETVRVGVVAYSDNAQVLFDPEKVGGNVEQMMDRIRREIVPTNSTNAEAGLRYGYEMALAEAQEGREVMVLLLSDGVANVGATGTDAILESIGTRADIGLSTIGVGLGPFNDALMEQLANKADGTYHYIDTTREARRIFVDNLTSLLAKAARDARVQVEFNPEVVATYRLLGFENRDIPDEYFRDDTRDAGEIGAGQSSTAVYELEMKGSLPELSDSQQGDSRVACDIGIATVTLRYLRPDSETPVENTATINIGDIDSSFAAASARFRLIAVAAGFAEVLRGSPYTNQNNDISQLLREARIVADDLADADDTSDVQEMIQLIQTAQRLKESSQ